MSIKILSYNIHKGESAGRARPTIELINKEITSHHADILFLQEVNSQHAEILQAGVWLHSCYGKNATYRNKSHGNLILSKFPIEFHQNIDLSTRKIDKRGMLHAIVYFPEKTTPTHLLCVHLGLLKRDRTKQVTKIIQFIKEVIPPEEPIILAGDFNDWTNVASNVLSEELGLVEAFHNHHQSHARTFPSWAPILMLDRLYFRGIQTNNAKRIIEKSWKKLSDHLALEVFLKLDLPK